MKWMLNLPAYLIFLIGLPCLAIGQTSQEEKPEPLYHQIFLDEPVIQIQKAVYQSDGKPIKTSISPDGKTIILHDYRGRATVKLLIKYQNGRVEELIKYSCHIVPYPYPSET